MQVPTNYTVKLIISEKNVGSSGNTNCNNDYIQVRDGANSSGNVLAKLCNSYPGPSSFRSTGTHLWVEYKSTQANNIFEASFKKLLNPSFCPTNVVSDGTLGPLPNPFYPADFPNDMECSWNITGQEGSRLVLLFNRVCLGICPNAELQECGCDSLTIRNVFKSRQLCLGSEMIPFISTENSISLTMLTDEQNPSKGYEAEYESVFLDRECSQMKQMTNRSGWFSSPSFPSNYPGEVQCGWNISIPSGYKIYLTFLDFELEKCGDSCTCNYVQVTLAKSGSSEKKCGTITSGEWVVRNVINDNILVTFKSDSHTNKKGFEAVYTLIPLRASIVRTTAPSKASSETASPTERNSAARRDCTSTKLLSIFAIGLINTFCLQG